MLNENNNNDPKNPEKKSSWLDDALEHINDDFPLSGNEPDDSLEFGDDDDNAGDDDVNKRFPLSGGESPE